eukprot:6044310-Pleurochrysis_carterae.AAC.1
MCKIPVLKKVSSGANASPSRSMKTSSFVCEGFACRMSELKNVCSLPSPVSVVCVVSNRLPPMLSRTLSPAAPDSILNCARLAAIWISMHDGFVLCRTLLLEPSLPSPLDRFKKITPVC